jgi:hypothetical protein
MEEPIQVSCPWCGETFDTFVDPSQMNQKYVEDCQVCCRPIEMRFQQDESGLIQGTTERE